jgi:hypothetical protein
MRYRRLAALVRPRLRRRRPTMGAGRRTGGGGSALGSGRGGVGMMSALAGFVVWVRPLQNLCGDARRSSYGPQIERVDRVERVDTRRQSRDQCG